MNGWGAKILKSRIEARGYRELRVMERCKRDFPRQIDEDRLVAVVTFWSDWIVAVR